MKIFAENGQSVWRCMTGFCLGTALIGVILTSGCGQQAEKKPAKAATSPETAPAKAAAASPETAPAEAAAASPETAPAPDALWESQRLAMLERYQNAKAAGAADAAADFTQVALSERAGNDADVERAFFQEIARWRLSSAASPEEYGWIDMHVREVYYRQALYSNHVQIDRLKELSYGSSEGMADAIYVGSIYKSFNELMLLPKAEALKREEAESHVVNFTRHGEVFSVHPGASVPFDMDFDLGGDKSERMSFKLRLFQEFECSNQRFALFHIYPDERGLLSSGGQFWLLAKMRDSEWCSVLLAEDDWIERATLQDGVLKLQTGRSGVGKFKTIVLWDLIEK